MRNSNSWTYKDKQITELSRSQQQQTDDFLDDEDERDYGYDYEAFQPEHKPTRIRLGNESFVNCVGSSEVDLISEIDKKIKEHVDNVLYEVKSLSSRVTQLESRMHKVENAVDNLKVAIEYNHGKTDGKLRELDNILREVQGGIKDLTDKQEIAEAQLQLAKLQWSKNDQQLGKQNNSSQTDSTQGVSSSVPQQSQQLLPNPVAPPQQPVASPQQPVAFPTNISQNLHYQNSLPTPAATAPQLPSQVPQNIIPSIPQNESYSPLNVQTPETTHQQYHVPSIQQSQPPPPPLYQPNQPKPIEATHQDYHMTSAQQLQLPPQSQHQPYQPAPQLPSVSQLDQPPQLHPPFNTVYYQDIYPLSQDLGEVPNLPSQSIRQPSVPPPGFPPSQMSYVGSSRQMRDQTSGQPYREFPSGYSLPSERSNSINLYPYGASPFGSSSTNMKPLRPLPSPSGPSGGSSYSQLPTAKILPHAIPMAASVDSESASGGSANRVQIDDVVDKVVAMGFRRDLVRATVRKLTENGQSVDLNVVLDKLMNNG